MNCQHLQQMLAFVERKCEELEPADRDAVLQHLAKCPACAELARTQRTTDSVLSAAMRDVPVPADLHQKVLKRLAAERRGFPWKKAVAATLVVVAIAAGSVWVYHSRAEVRLSDATSYVERGDWDTQRIEKYFEDQGVPVRVPTDFDFRFLQHVDVVDFGNGRRVPRLTFSRIGDPAAFATVLILSTKDYRIDDPELNRNQEIPHTTSIRIHPGEDGRKQFIDLIYYRGPLDALRSVPN